MRRIILFTVLLITGVVLLESTTPGYYHYVYDDAGNRTHRIYHEPVAKKSIDAGFTDSLITVNPNPAVSFVNIEIRDINKYHSVILKLYDYNGNLIETHNNITSTVTKLDLGMKSNGLYYIVVNYDGTERRFKIIKKA